MVAALAALAALATGQQKDNLARMRSVSPRYGSVFGGTPIVCNAAELPLMADFEIFALR